MPASRPNESNEIKFLLTIFGTLVSAGICITAIVLTSIHGFALYNLGVILSFAFTAILSVVELLRYRDEQQSNRQSSLAKVLALLSTLLFAATAIAVILLSGDFASGILVTALTGIVACWTAAIFNDTQKTQETATEKKSQPWTLIISNLLIIGVSLAAQIMTLLLVHQASLAYIFIVSGFNLALSIPVLFFSCRKNTFKENSWPLVAIAAIVAGLFIAGSNFAEFHSGLSVLGTIGAIFSTIGAIGGFLYALSHNCGKNESGDVEHQSRVLIPSVEPQLPVSNSGPIVANTEDLSSSAAAPSQISTQDNSVVVDPHQSLSASHPS